MGKRRILRKLGIRFLFFYDLKRPCSGGSKKVYWGRNKRRRPVARPP